MTRVGWRLGRGFARACVRAFYGAFRVTGAARIPGDGPALFVVNHPGDLADAAAVLLAVPRPLRLAARRSLRDVLVPAWILRRRKVLGAGEGAGEAAALLQRRRLGAGGAVAFFAPLPAGAPSGRATVGADPAAVAFDAEADAEFGLGLRVVPVALHHEPRREFRGEVEVRVGEPFGIADLRRIPRDEALADVRERIAAALRPHVRTPDAAGLERLVHDVADVYDEHQRAAGGGLVPRPKADVVRVARACLDHFLATDPGAVEATRRRHERYRRLAARARVTGRSTAVRAHPVRGVLGTLLGTLGLVAGLPVAAYGLLTSYLPYRATDAFAHAASRRRPGASLAGLRLRYGVPCFGLYWGLYLGAVALWSRSVPFTLFALAATVGAALFARAWALHAAGWWRALQGLVPALRPGVARVARARLDLLQLVDDLVRRYRREAGGDLLPPRRRTRLRRVPWRGVVAVAAAVWLAWFAWGLGDRRIADLPDRPSPWPSLPRERARVVLEHDAHSLLALLDTLEALEARMDFLKAGFDAGERSFTDVSDDRAIRRALLTYLNCRGALFRLAWFYRAPDRTGEEETSERAFLVGYVAALELVRRGMQLVAVFEDHPDAVRKLNEGDQAWGLPAGVFDRVRRNLANTNLYDELAAAAGRFERTVATRAREQETHWARIREQARSGREAVAALAERLWHYKWASAVARAQGEMEAGRYAVSRFFAGLVGGVRVRGGELADGLIDPAQVEWLRRERLQPGDILLERRNWALTNVFLPGYWTHAALYLGGVEGLRLLGLEEDPRVTPHLEALARPDEHGHPRAIVEALAPGVVLTSLETSVGEADALCVLRPRLARAQIADAMARALCHVGKPYDFDFDFFSSDKLVCTELVHRAYQGPLRLELREIMGRETLPAQAILEKWAVERGREDAQLDLVCFLDAVEDEGVAREGDEASLLSTLQRPGLTLFQTYAGSATAPLVALVALGALFVVGLVFLRRARYG